MKIQLRPLIASALYPTKAHSLPSVCERFGLAPGDGQEAFASKTTYVMRRLETLSDERVLALARAVVADYPDDKLQSALEQLEGEGQLVTDITRHNLAEALNPYNVGGKRDLLDLLRKHFPQIDTISSYRDFGGSLADDIYRHVVVNDDWNSTDLLEHVGILTCSQARLFQFLEDIVHPVRRDQDQQNEIVADLNPILRRDGYVFAAAGRISGYGIFKVRKTAATGAQPADALISESLIAFDETGVHAAWQKALDRREVDPGGAITAAKALLETVCKHIIEETKGSYSESDDLPRLYSLAAESLSLAPSQHSEQVFKAILGNCQAVVGHLAAIRNKLGDSHGQGKRRSRPLARHAGLAVNLAGSMAMFLIATWNARAVSGTFTAKKDA